MLGHNNRTKIYNNCVINKAEFKCELIFLVKHARKSCVLCRNKKITAFYQLKNIENITIIMGQNNEVFCLLTLKTIPNKTSEFSNISVTKEKKKLKVFQHWQYCQQNLISIHISSHQSFGLKQFCKQSCWNPFYDS